jgi:hypothetical protein
VSLMLEALEEPERVTRAAVKLRSWSVTSG